MGREWQIGDPVDYTTDGWMDAQNWGRGGSDEDDQSSGSHGGYRRYRPPVDREEMNRRSLRYKKDAYQSNLKKAREEKNDEYRIRYYGEALKCARQYFEESERLGITVDGMPDRSHVLSSGDVDWISKKHYGEFEKLHILSTDQTANLERLLKESGNGHIIKRNEETRRQRNKENARKREIDYVKYLKADYFKHIEKANGLVLKGKFEKAMKEYQKAVSTYDDFFKRDSAPVKIMSKMPEKSLTPEAVDHIMIIYKRTHPLLTSRKKHHAINRQILDMLEGDWDDRLSEADREAAQILEQRNLERQKRKQKVEDIATDVIVGARIVGDNILKRLRK